MQLRLTLFLAFATLVAGCSPADPTIKDGFIETSVSQAGERGLALAKTKQFDQPVTVSIGGTDAHGNHTETPALVFRWQAHDLAQLNFNGATRYTVLDLSTVEIRDRLGVQALSSWCNGDGGGQVLTPKLCGKTYVDAVTRFMSTP